MTKAEIVSKISDKLGLDRNDVQLTVENFMDEVISSLESGQNVYLRGFGSFIIKTRAEKTGRNISKNTTIKIPIVIENKEVVSKSYPEFWEQAEEVSGFRFQGTDKR